MKKATKKVRINIEIPAKPPDTVPEPQPHGGALKRGNNPGPWPGAGRPPSAVKAQLREVLADSVPVLREFAEGTVRVPLEQVCEHCGKPPTAKTVKDAIETRVSDSDRLRAIDISAKYSMPTRGYDQLEVRNRLSLTLDIVRALAGERWDDVRDELAEIWHGL